MARSHDPPPGNMVIWRGMRKLNDMLEGYRLARKQANHIDGTYEAIYATMN